MSERSTPWVFSGLMAVVSAGLLFGAELRIPPGMHDLMNTTVSLAAITIGFVSTAKSILASIDDRPFVVELKRAQLYGQMIDYMLTAIHASMVLAVMSGAGLLFDLTAQRVSVRVFVVAWAAMVALAGGTYYRVISLFARILKRTS